MITVASFYVYSARSRAVYNELNGGSIEAKEIRAEISKLSQEISELTKLLKSQTK